MNILVPNLGGTGINLPYNNWSIILILIVIFAAQLIAFYEKNIFIPSNFKPFTLFILLFITPISIFDLEKIIDTSNIAAIIIAGFFISLYQSGFNKEKLSKTLIYACFIQAIIGIFQAFSPIDTSHSLLFSNRGVPTGIFLQPNLLASYLATGLALCIFHYETYLDKQKSSTLILIFIGLTLLIVSLLTGSRTGWIAISVIFSCYLFYCRSSHKKIITVSIFILAGLISANILSSISEAISHKNSHKLSQITDASITKRLTSYRQSFDMILERPISGYGIGEFQKSYIEFSAKKHYEDKSYPTSFPDFYHPHNEILYWWIERGILSILALIYLIIFSTREILENKINTLLKISLFIPIAIHAQTEFPLTQSIPHIMILLAMWFIVDEKPFKKALKIEKNIIFLSSLPVLFSIAILGNNIYNTSNLYYFQNFHRDTKLIKRQTFLYFPQEYKMNSHIKTIELQKAIFSSNYGYVREYLDWAAMDIEDHPDPNAYQHIITASRYLKETELAKTFLTKGKYLFPDFDYKIYF